MLCSRSIFIKISSAVFFSFSSTTVTPSNETPSLSNTFSKYEKGLFTAFFNASAGEKRSLQYSALLRSFTAGAMSSAANRVSRECAEIRYLQARLLSILFSGIAAKKLFQKRFGLLMGNMGTFGQQKGSTAANSLLLSCCFFFEFFDKRRIGFKDHLNFRRHQKLLSTFLFHKKYVPVFFSVSKIPKFSTEMRAPSANFSLMMVIAVANISKVFFVSRLSLLRQCGNKIFVGHFYFVFAIKSNGSARSDDYIVKRSYFQRFLIFR